MFTYCELFEDLLGLSILSAAPKEIFSYFILDSKNLTNYSS